MTGNKIVKFQCSIPIRKAVSVSPESAASRKAFDPRSDSRPRIRRVGELWRRCGQHRQRARPAVPWPRRGCLDPAAVAPSASGQRGGPRSARWRQRGCRWTRSGGPKSADWPPRDCSSCRQTSVRMQRTNWRSIVLLSFIFIKPSSRSTHSSLFTDLSSRGKRKLCTVLFVPSVAMFCSVFLFELRGPALVVGRWWKMRRKHKIFRTIRMYYCYCIVILLYQLPTTLPRQEVAAI